MFGDNNVLDRRPPSLLRQIICLIIIILGVMWIYFSLFPIRNIVYENNSSYVVDVNQDPVQGLYLGNGKITIRSNNVDFILSPLANYKIAGKVVAYNHYNYEIDSKLSPVDLCLVWSEVVKKDAYDYVSYYPSYRACNFKVKHGSKLYTTDYISLHTSNNHLIPANDNIRNALLNLHNEEIVYLEGYLVNVDATLGNGQKYIWHTSLIRTDSGCEIIYVTRVVINEKLVQ